MERFIVIKFRNAKLFRNKRTSKDKVLGDGGSEGDKRDAPWFVEPITVHQVSNLLHVLFGERPVPSARNGFLAYGRDEAIYKVAENCLLKVDSLQQEHELKDGTIKKQFVMETVRIKKAVFNSWSNQTLPIYWERVRAYMDVSFDEFLLKLEALLGKGQMKRPWDEVWKGLNAQKDTEKGREFLLYLEMNKFKIFANYIRDHAMGVQLNMMKNRTAVTVVNGVDTAAFIEGSILVPVTDELIERARNYAGQLTILDGGLAWVVGLRSGHDIDPAGYRRVGDISLTTY